MAPWMQRKPMVSPTVLWLQPEVWPQPAPGTGGRCQNKKKAAMAYPTPGHHSPLHGAVSRGHQPAAPANQASARSGFPVSTGEGEHQLEKLEFALAVALTRGDLQRSQSLRDQIAALGGNQEEPGT